MILPFSRSASSILPGLILPFSVITASLMGNAPASEDKINRSSEVIKYLNGRRPFRSKVAPKVFPLVNNNAAGPSQGSTKARSEEHTSELQSRENLVCRL